MIRLHLCCFLLLLGGPALADIAGRASVIDGDTLDVRGQRVRLWGVDAPEGGQTCADAAARSYRCGQRAALALADWSGPRPVTCRAVDRDQYGRVVARCTVGGQDLGDWLVRRGLALDYRQFSGGAYAHAEAQARLAKEGLWAGRFTEPWAWRRETRSGQGAGQAPSATPRAAAPGCRVKGNINSKGERFYHAPGMASYAETQISTAKGERWFCSEAEARTAGWRAPGNAR